MYETERLRLEEEQPLQCIHCNDHCWEVGATYIKDGVEITKRYCCKCYNKIYDEDYTFFSWCDICKKG